MTNTAVTKHVHPNGDVTLTDTINGSKEYRTKEQWARNAGKDQSKDESKDKKGLVNA